MAASLLFGTYVLAFTGAALACLIGAWRAARIEVPGARRGLVSLLISSAGWAAFNVAYVFGSSFEIDPLVHAWFYDLGLVCGFATVWAWLYLCFALAGRGIHRNVRTQAFGLSVIGIVTITKITNPLHGLYFTTTAAMEPFPHLAIDHHSLFWVSLGLSYALAAIGYFVLYEFLARTRGGTRPLVALFGLLALPSLLNMIGYASPLLLDISHEPLGVAAFAIGVLFIYNGQFQEISLVSQHDGPALAVGADDHVRTCNEAAMKTFPALARASRERKRLAVAMPKLSEAIENGTLFTVDEGPGRRFYQVRASSLTGDVAEGGTLVRLTEVTERQQRWRLEEARHEGVAESLPGLEFQYRATPEDRPAYRHVGRRATEVLGIPPEPEPFEERFLARVPEAYHERYWSCTEGGAVEGQTSRIEIPFNRPDGEQIWLLLSSQAERQEVPGEGETLLLSGIMLDITERKRARAQADLQTEVLRRAAEGAPLEETLSALVEGLEGLYPGMLGSVLLRDDQKNVLRHGAAPSLPDEYVRAVDGLPISPGEGSCGTAAYRGEPVVAEDIKTDPRWKSYRDLALRHKLRASWSVPIQGSDGEILGTFAMYYHEAKIPSETDRALLNEAQSLARIAIERHRNAERLRLLSQSVAQSTEAVLITKAENVDPPGPEIVYANRAFEDMTGYTLEEIQGQTPRILQGPATDRATLDSLRTALEAGEPWEGETINYRKDGTLYQVRWKVAPVTGTDGSIQHWTSVQRDVTEQRRQEDELRHQKDLLEQTQRLAGAWEADLRSNTLSWSEEVYRICEVDPETDLVIGDALKFYAPDVQPKIQEAFQRCVDEREPYDLELPLDTAEGNRRWVRAVGAPVEEEDGNVVRVAGALQDITARKEAEQRLRRQNDLFRRAQEIASVGAWEYDPETDQLIWTDQVYEIHDLPPQAEVSKEEAIGHYHPDDRPNIQEALTQAIEASTPYDLELRLKTADDEERWVRTRGEPQQRDGQKPLVRGTIQDITALKERAEELRRTKDFYKQILAEVPIDLAVFTPDAEYEYVNPESVADPEMREWLKGRTNEEYCHKRGLDVEMGTKRDEAIRRAARENETVAFEETLPSGEGPRHFYRAHAPITDLDGNARSVVGFGIDITEAKHREQRLREAKEEAERMNQLKSAFLANMSHEIRTPLTSILGFAEAIGAETSGADEQGEVDLSTLSHFSGLIERSGRRLMETLDAVLDLSKLQAGEMDLNLGALDLAAEAEEMAEQFALQAEKKGVDLSVSSEDRPVWAWADDGGVRIALRNLISNAIKYTEDGDQVWVRVREEKDSALVEVEDTGVGMDPTQVETLFEAFKQGSEGIDREYEGSGLGLTVTQRVLSEMGGTVEVETEEGVGTCFTVRLPRPDDAPGEV